MHLSDGEGTQLILATDLTASPADAPSFAAIILTMEKTIGLPRTVPRGLLTMWQKYGRKLALTTFKTFRPHVS